MTEGCLRNDGEIIRCDSEIVRRNSETIQREDSIMGCGHKDNKGSLGPDPPSSVGHHKFPLSLSDGPKEIWKKGGRVFSVLLAINLALLACTLISGGAFQEVHVYDYDAFFLLTIVMIITTLWMLFYIFRTSKRRNAIPYKDAHAGPIWLRGGLIMFGILTVVMDVFKTGYYASVTECLIAIKIIYPVVQAVFVVVQTYFLWVSSKDCVHVHLDATRCGLMLTLTTNLAVWMAAVTDESVHKAQSKLSNNSTHRSHEMRVSSDKCHCATKLCHIFQDGYFWLYPFNIEYSLFASAMVYVMWKNVGRLIEEHANQIHNLKFKFFRGTYFVGIIFGLLFAMTGVAVFIVYEIKMNSSHKSESKNDMLGMYYIFHIVCLSLMSVITVGGSIVYRFDKRDMDHHKNPTRTLDVALLMGAALGQYAISYYSIVAIVASEKRDAISALNLTYSLLMIAQPTFQNIFIIEGLHRQPPKENDKTDSQRKESLYGLSYVNMNAVSFRVPESGSAVPPTTPPQIAIQTSSEVVQSIKVSRKFHWRRKFLKEISLFLLLCNAVLWIIPAFGARPQFDNNKERLFYGDSMWAAIVDICLPFGIFYRMHTVASLLEVYIMS